MKTRLSEIAEFAGVSKATVGRVLNGKPGIAPETRDAVLTALDVFGFERPGPLPRRDGRPGRPGRARPAEPDLPDVRRGRLVAPGQAGSHAGALHPHRRRRLRGALHRLLLKHEVAGILFIAASYADAGPELGRELRERRVPIVLINAADDNAGRRHRRVDDGAAVDQAFAHLTSLGHERIGLVLGPVGHVPSARKLAAFKAQQERRAPRRELAKPDRAHRLLDRGRLRRGGPAAGRAVTAIVCASDALALGAIRAVRRAGLQVPDDVSVVGFDDSCT